MRIDLDGLDDRADLARGRSGAFGQLADLVGHDGKPTTVFPGANRFDRGVESQHVGPAGNPADQVDDDSDLVRSIFESLGLAAVGFDLSQQPVHPLDHAMDLFQAAPRLVAGSLAGLRGFLGIGRDPVDLLRQGLDGRRGAADCIGLVGSPRGNPLVDLTQ